MNILAVFVSLILLILTFYYDFKIKKNKLLNPITLFYAIWTIVLFLSTLNLYNIKKPSDEAYLLIILMLLFFFIGFIINISINNKSLNFFSRSKKTNNDGNIATNKKNEKAEINFVFFYIICVLIIIFNIIDCIIVIQQIRKGVAIWQIRNWSLEPFGSNNPILDRRTFIEDVFRSVVMSPFMNIIYPITAYYFFNTTNIRKKYILLGTSILVLITSSLAGAGGRFGFIYYVFSFLISFIYMCKNESENKEKLKKIKKNIFIIISFGIIFVVLFTTFRTGIGNLFKQAYTYFAVSPTLLSEWLPKVKTNSYTYGLTTFFGFHSYIFRIMEALKINQLVPDIYNLSFNNIINAEKFLNVGYGVANAFVTPVYYFYNDGGYLFVCIASSFFGFIISKLVNKFESDINAKNFIFYVLIMYGIILAFVRVQTTAPSYILSFIFVYLIFCDNINKKVKSAIIKTLKNPRYKRWRR